MNDLAHRPWNAWRVARWSIAATLLAIPAVAMQFPGSGFDWTVGDFVFAGAMIGGAGLLYEAAAKLFENHPHFTIFPGESVEIMPVLPIPGGG